MIKREEELSYTKYYYTYITLFGLICTNKMSEV